MWKNAGEGISYIPVSESPTVSLLVTRVIDGDTFTGRVTSSIDSMFSELVTVRLIGVNAPETVDPKKKPEPYGKEASDHLRALIENKNIELQFDATRTDVYGRWLGYVLLNGSLIQEDLLRKGYAKFEDRFGFARKTEFAQWENEAKELKTGLWGNGKIVSVIGEGGSVISNL